MKFELLKIYQDVSSGKLTQKEALEKIKVVKQQNAEETRSVLLAKSDWTPVVLDVSSNDEIEYEQYHLILCEISHLKEKHINSSLSPSKVWNFRIDQEQHISKRFSEYALSCFELIQNILINKPEGKVLIQLVVPNEGEQIILAGLSGLLKTAALENPLIIPQLLLIDPKIQANDLALQLKDNQSNPDDQLIKYEQGIRYVLKREEIYATEVHSKIAFKDQGVYLITGGMGGLGLLFTKEILKQTTRSRIILTGRSVLTAEKKVLLEALPSRDNKVEYYQLELDNAKEVNKVISGIVKEKGGLNGILHCAGMTSDNFIIKKTSEEFIRVLSPKVSGAYNLDQSSKDIDLDFIVLFSSVASQLGNVGQSDYAAANGFMDEFAIYRNQEVARGHRMGHTLSINWPLWEEGGMQINRENQEALRKKYGMYPMPATTGIDAFYKTLELGYGQALVVEGNSTQIRRAFLENREEKAKPVLASSHNEQQAVSTVNTENLQGKTEKYLCDQFAILLKLASHKIDSNAPLEKYGIDSILAMSLTDQLEKTFGSLPKTLFFEYQTIQELAEYFSKSHTSQLSKLFISGKKVQKKEIEETSKKETGSISKIQLNRRRRIVTPKGTDKLIQSDPIVIVGLSGRYPESVNIASYWENLREGRDCITEVPKDRWDWRDYYSDNRTKTGRHYSKWGGFISGVDEFDPRFFNISPREATSIDPQERLFLEHVWMAIEDAGYTRSSLQIPHKDGLPGQVGVYVGMMYSEYQLFGAEASMQGNPTAISGSYASIANRVSYFLNLHGPSMTLDTMCSSSLTAIHLACQDLKEGRTDLGIAGGVNVSVHPNKYLMLSTGQFISSDGHCQSFGEGGDGYIPGEGVGTVILKRLSEAKRDGNHIYGVIKGSSLNHGGKTNGYSVPNPKAQASAIHQALAASGTDPRHISYIEAHGTGTKLGDPIEISALTKAFEGDNDSIKTGYCQIGSAKSNIGHCESAAGIAGLTKVLLQMRYRQIVPSLHSNRLNPHIDFDKTPFIVNQKLRDWDAPVLDGKELPRIAGISSFGAGGSNAHLIIEEYTDSDVFSFNGSESDFMIPLSAKKPLQLEQKVRDLLDFIHFSIASGDSLDLGAMAYTFQVGRESMDERVGFMVSSVDELTQKLESYLKDTDNITGIYRGQVKRDRDLLSGYTTGGLDIEQMVQQWIKDRNYSFVIEVWSKGQDIDWQELYLNTHPKLISLPTYPFARERYWIDIVDTKASVQGKVTSVLHPLLHRNISDLSYQIYSSTFRGDEFYISGSQDRELPVSVYLEMARAAIADSLPNKEKSTTIEFRDIVWIGPLSIQEDLRVDIALLPQTKDIINFEIYGQEGEEELIYCQGSSIVSTESSKAILDIAMLKKQIGNEGIRSAYGLPLSEVVSVYHNSTQLLIQLTLPESLPSSEEAYRLHPMMLENALQLGSRLFFGDGQSLTPMGIASLEVIDSCTREMFVWLRPSNQAGTLDIDLCNKQGEVCVQVRGVGYEGEVEILEEAPVSEHKVSEVSLPTEEVMMLPKELPIPIRVLHTTDDTIISSGE
ncbi:SDR family NAD(P)-dependent oxidoreductase, partial [Aquimarina spinulae]